MKSGIDLAREAGATIHADLLEAAVGVVTVPVAVVADVVTMGGALTDKDQPYTADAVEGSRLPLRNPEKTMNADSICIIPARGGSRRIPGKNMKDFRGKPMIQYAIEAARKSRLFLGRGVWVSTDSTEIAELTYSLGALVIMRDPELAVDEVGTQQVMRHALSKLGMHRRDIACCIYPCSPLLSIDDLILGYDTLAVQGTRYAMSVGTSPLCDAGNFYWGYAGHFMDDDPLIAPGTAMVPIAPERVCDINTPEDWLRAERLFDNLKGK